MAELVNVLAPLLAIEPQPVDDPDAVFYENYVCGAQRNYTVYCNPEVDKMVDSQSMESSVEKRKRMVWNIEKKLAEDDARPTHVWRPAGNRG